MAPIQRSIYPALRQSLAQRLGPANSLRAISTPTQPGKKFSKDESTKLKPDEASPSAAAEAESHASTPPKKSQAEADEELRQKLEEMSGDGGASGIEFEDGKPVSMKRSVKNNMFRYI